MTDAPKTMWAWPNTTDSRGWYAAECSNEPTMVYADIKYHHDDTVTTAIARAYQMGVDAAALTASCECCCGPITLEAKILALTPPADLVEKTLGAKP